MKQSLTLTGAALLTLGLSQAAQAEGFRNLDRLEDRIDRRESILDERVDHGRRDVIEDRIDRRESARDRAGLPTSRAVNRWERRSWRARWGRN